MPQTEPTRRLRADGELANGHEQLRRVGRAIIALARAQLEAEAQAAHEAGQTRRDETREEQAAEDDHEQPG